MSAVAVEQISPELVASRTRDRVPSEPMATSSAGALQATVATLLRLGRLSAVVALAAVLLTHALTIVADITR
jgi:hypothetical protein